MAFQKRLAAVSEEPTTDETAAESETAEGGDARDNSPFSMSYDLSSYDVDDEAIDHGLSALVAITNLL